MAAAHNEWCEMVGALWSRTDALLDLTPQSVQFLDGSVDRRECIRSIVAIGGRNLVQEDINLLTDVVEPFGDADALVLVGRLASFFLRT